VLHPGDIGAQVEGLGQTVFADLPGGRDFRNNVSGDQVVVGQMNEQILDIVDRNHFLTQSGTQAENVRIVITV
jgi:hypothetical protein